MLEDPPGLVATLAHELGDVILSNLGITDVVPNYEFLTDLMTVFLGLGLLTAKAAFRSECRQDLAGSGWPVRYRWEISHTGYLTEQMYGYALASCARRKGEDSPDWQQYLSVNIRSYFRAVGGSITRF